MYLYIPAFASEPSFTGFRGVLRDANMPVPDAQHPPADTDIDRGDPCPGCLAMRQMLECHFRLAN